jgi:hypothetical protein
MMRGRYWAQAPQRCRRRCGGWRTCTPRWTLRPFTRTPSAPCAVRLPCTPCHAANTPSSVHRPDACTPPSICSIPLRHPLSPRLCDGGDRSPSVQLATCPCYGGATRRRTVGAKVSTGGGILVIQHVARDALQDATARNILAFPAPVRHVPSPHRVIHKFNSIFQLSSIFQCTHKLIASFNVLIG